jgi:hypothetical protein
MNSGEDKLYTKIIVLDTSYNFVVEKFLVWNSLELQNIVLSSWISNFKI